MKKSLLTLVLEFILGHKYYVNIIATKGVIRTECTSFIHPTKESAMRHKSQIDSTTSFQYMETVSFRSRHEYVLSDKIS